MLYIEQFYCKMADVSFCQQRTIRQLYNVPLPRINMDAINPYLSGKYTKSQLDMRRKVEILKYNSNKVAGQTNSLTKREKFAMLVRGSIKSPSQIILQGGVIDCSYDNYIPTPTSSCDVPGHVTYLQEDPNVPLYNYSSFNIRSYPDYIPTKTDYWNLVSLPDAAIYTRRQQQTSAPAYYLIIYNAINEPQYTYNVRVPVGIVFSGDASTNDVNNPSQVKMTSATLNVYYNLNLARQLVITDNLPMFVVTPTSQGKFSASELWGTLYFTGLQLYTAPTYVYSFSLQIEFSSETLNITSYDILANPTIKKDATNCVVTNLNIYNPTAAISPVF